MFENQRAKRHLRGRPVATTAPALRKAHAHRLEHRIDQRVVLKNFIDATKPRIHLLLGLEIPELKHLPESALTVATAKHPDF